MCGGALLPGVIHTGPTGALKDVNARITAGCREDLQGFTEKMDMLLLRSAMRL